MEEIKQCGICGNAEFSAFMECTDHFLSQKSFSLAKCKKCGFIFVNPRPKKNELPEYYDSPEYISHSGTNKGFVNSVYKIVRKFTHHKKIKLVSAYAKGKSVLDMGCGSGELLKLFKQHHWETIGIEPNPNARKFAELIHKLNVADETYIKEIPENSMDAIMLWHVLEHVPDVNERMQELKRILKSDGVLVIATPNCMSYDAQYYGKYWAAYDVPRHLHHFTPATMKQFAVKFKFSIVEILPMKFDSYYASMLSEKYKTKKSHIMKALYVGLKSNIKARKDKSYSSLIYVIRNS